MAIVFKEVGGVLTGSVATYYTAPPTVKVSILYNGHFANMTQSVASPADATFYAEIYKGGVGPSRILADTLPIPVQTSFSFDKPFNLEANDVFRAYADATNKVDMSLSIVELT